MIHLMDLTGAIYEFLQDGREVIRARLPGLSAQLNSAVLKAKSALFLSEQAGANSFIIYDAVGIEVARWKAGDPNLA